MKTIENKKTNVPGSVEKYSDLIMHCVKNPPKGGYDISEMRRRIRVMDVTEKGGEILEFEDADFDCVKKCVKNMRWGFVHQEIINFDEYISGL